MTDTFEHQMVVRREHLNPYGSLSGGAVLATVDELAFVACARTYPGRNFVARAVLGAELTAPARLGDVLEFTYGIEHRGRTSVHVRVEMLVHDSTGGRAAEGFDGAVVMVCVDREGRPAPLVELEEGAMCLFDPAQQGVGLRDEDGYEVGVLLPRPFHRFAAHGDEPDGRRQRGSVRASAAVDQHGVGAGLEGIQQRQQLLGPGPAPGGHPDVQQRETQVRARGSFLKKIP